MGYPALSLHRKIRKPFYLKPIVSMKQKNIVEQIHILYTMPETNQTFAP